MKFKVAIVKNVIISHNIKMKKNKVATMTNEFTIIKNRVAIWRYKVTVMEIKSACFNILAYNF